MKLLGSSNPRSEFLMMARSSGDKSLRTSGGKLATTSGGKSYESDK